MQRSKDREKMQRLAEQGSQLLAMENTITLLANRIFGASDRYIKKYGDENQRERTKLPFFSTNRRSFGTWLGAKHTHANQARELKELSEKLKTIVTTIQQHREHPSNNFTLEDTKNQVLETLSQIYDKLDDLGGGTLESKLGNVNTLAANVILSLDPKLNQAAKAVEQEVRKGVLGVFLNEEVDLKNNLQNVKSFTELPDAQKTALLETYGKLNSPQAIRNVINSLIPPREERKDKPKNY